MDVIEKVRRLLAMMGENDVAELEIEEPELRVRIKTNAGVQYSHPAALTEGQTRQALPAAEGTQEQEEPAEQDSEVLEMTSPMVGTFYRAPSEGAEPYVNVGSVVEPDTIVCIVEAMKVMNEVKAEVSGEIVEILVQNAEPVEFGQVLFLVRPLEQP